MDIRVLHLDGATLEDKTVASNNYYTGTSVLDIVASTDYLYLGSRFPFNHLYFKFSVVNTNASVLSAAIWNGKEWKAVKELFDSTSLNGATFGQSGYIQWNPDKATSWSRDDTQGSSGTERVTGLGDIQIYDHYWVRFAFSADLINTTALSWVGNLFSNDSDLGTEFPDLVRTETMNGWSATGSKTSWEEQHVKAAQIILKELKQKNVTVHEGQILNYKDFTDASVAKVAEIAFRNMGPAFLDTTAAVQGIYKDRMIDAIGASTIDYDQNASADRDEIILKQGRISRG